MTATTSAPSVNGASGIRLGAALPTRQRKPAWIALAVALIVGLGAVGAYLWQQAGAKVPVVVVVSHVQVGDVIERSDLSTVDIAGGVTAIGAANMDSVLGQVAAVELLPNTLLQRSMLTDSAPWVEGESQVGVAVSSGQLPADGLSPGDVVQVLRLPESPTGDPVTLVDRASVYTVREDPVQSGGWLITLVVPAELAPAVSTVSGTKFVALIQVAP